MNFEGLSFNEVRLIRDCFSGIPAVERVILFGSRAKGKHRHNSDVDLAIVGVAENVEIVAIVEALDDLPLPYKFDVQSLDTLRHAPLREHIDRVGKSIYERA